MDVVERSKRIIVFGIQVGWEESFPLIPDLKAIASLSIVHGRTIVICPLKA